MLRKACFLFFSGTLLVCFRLFIYALSLSVRKILGCLADCCCTWKGRAGGVGYKSSLYNSQGSLKQHPAHSVQIQVEQNWIFKKFLWSASNVLCATSLHWAIILCMTVQHNLSALMCCVLRVYTERSVCVWQFNTTCGASYTCEARLDTWLPLPRCLKKNH